MGTPSPDPHGLLRPLYPSFPNTGRRRPRSSPPTRLAVCTMPGNRCAFLAPGARKGAAALTHHASQPRPADPVGPTVYISGEPWAQERPEKEQGSWCSRPLATQDERTGLVPFRAQPGTWSPKWVSRPHAPDAHSPSRASEASKSWSTVWRQREGKSEAAWGNEGSGAGRTRSA